MNQSKRPRGRPPHPDVLTPAEWKVVEAVRHGLSNPQIAKRRGVSIDAVKFHVANAVLKLGLNNRAELRRWDGVQIGSVLHDRKERINMVETRQFGAIGQIARSVSDIGAARHFYGEVLGLAHLYSFGNLAFYDCGGVRLFLSEGDGNPSESILYLRSADIHADRDALAARGVKFVDAPHMIHRHEDGTEEWMSFFEDNEGRPLALMMQAVAAV